MWDTSKKLYIPTRNVGHFNRYFREKILFFLLLLFPLLCSTKKTQGNAVCAKKSASGKSCERSLLIIWGH